MEETERYRGAKKSAISAPICLSLKGTMNVGGHH
jgi:hypothetical protein